MSNNQFRIELHGNYEDPIGDFAPGEKYSHIQFMTVDQFKWYGDIKYALYSKFDHNVLEEMDGFRFYGLNGDLEVENWITFTELEEFIEENN